MQNSIEKTKHFRITKKLVMELTTTVDAGLCNGKGVRKPGEMCVEAAVCYAMGLPHGDRPTCVAACVREFKIRLNDSRWSSNKARAKGLRRIAVAQLGSEGVVDPKKFCALLAEQTIRQIVPLSMRSAAKVNPKFADKLEAAAVRCEKEGTEAASRAAREVAADAAYAATDAERDRILSLKADIGVEVLRACGSPGCEWLYLLDTD